MGLLSRLLVFLTCASAALAQTSVRHGIWLEIPEIQGGTISLPNNGAAVLPAGSVRFVRLHLNQQPAQVTYGSISTRVNAEVANVVSVQRSTAEGIICDIDLERNRSLALHPGRNSVEVSYKDRWNQVHYASFLLQLPVEPAKNRPKFPPALVSRGNTYAVVIGISRYKYAGPHMNNLRYASVDAASVRDFLHSPQGAGVSSGNIQSLLDEDATVENVRTALVSNLERVHDTDTLILYLNLQGVHDLEGGEDKYLLEYDSDPDDLAHTAISLSELPKLLSLAATSAHIVVIADTCHDSNLSAPDPAGRSHANNLVNQYLVRAAEQANQTALEASDIGEHSAEGDQWGGGHGAFTYYLLKGLVGEADMNGDGTVTLAELSYWVQNEVSKVTDGAELPMIQIGDNGGLVLSGIKPASRTQSVSSRQHP